MPRQAAPHAAKAAPCALSARNKNHPAAAGSEKRAGKRRKLDQAAAGPASAKRRRKEFAEEEEEEEEEDAQSESGDDGGAAAASNGDVSSGDADEDGGEGEIVNVEFEFFDPRETDLPTFKNLLAALFDADAEMFNLSQLADLIIGQPLLGSTVKVNGIDSDPFAMLSVLNMNDVEVMKQIKKYVLDKVKDKDPAFHSLLSKLLEDTSGKQSVGLLLTERLVNMPAQIAPPMFRMLAKEIQWAIDEKEPYDFTHYLLLSKIYRTVASDLLDVPDEDGEGRTVVQKKKKSKKKSEGGAQGDSEFGKDLFYYAPEHEVVRQVRNARRAHAMTSTGAAGRKTFRQFGLFVFFWNLQLVLLRSTTVRQFAKHSCAFSLTHAARKSVADARRAFHEFGIVPAIEAFLIPAANLEPIIGAMEEIVAE
ncbi:MAG: p21-C-terminal region-binding protein-domain-containing protein [Olpidium bornovanus]|uniref:P21-C-terminal region-binding protein-domain-containing protein n=1 Tax=Olpidium bornovanus TaxID=278681 RepID=A0A8H7ZTL2_9FUNG|nr:MAG: p21-C-terminal region-binding protein-domain-containing protein [Olpidium bornovanus]